MLEIPMAPFPTAIRETGALQDRGPVRVSFSASRIFPESQDNYTTMDKRTKRGSACTSIKSSSNHTPNAAALAVAGGGT
jgi:hypothetical protein